MYFARSQKFNITWHYFGVHRGKNPMNRIGNNNIKDMVFRKVLSGSAVNNSLLKEPALHKFVPEFWKKVLLAYCKTRHYWKQRISKYLPNLFLNGLNLCCRIHSWALILESVFSIYSIRQMNISSLRNYRRTYRAKKLCVSCTPILGSRF